MKRKLTTILAADVVGYSRLMSEDEDGTLQALKALRKDLVAPLIREHGGRVVKLMGDGLLAEFGSVVQGVNCAVAIQRGAAERNRDVDPQRQIRLRIGINLGDVIIEGSDIYGDGVNVAARLEGLAAPGGICISDTVHRHVRSKLGLAFEDMGAQRVKNIAEPIQVFAIALEETAPPPEPASGQAPTGSDKPSIAVLPFTNMSGDPEQEYFSDGLVEDIITTLSKLAGLRVIARNSSFVYKGRAVDIRQVAKELGVQYVLEGSVRHAGNRIRITAQLIDASSGSHIWAERYDRAIDDIFAVQDEITLVLATEMQVRLTEGEQARLRYTKMDNVEAWSHWVQGLYYYRQAVTKENVGAALSSWEKALALAPESASLNAMIGFIHYVDARFGWWDDRETARSKAQSYADRALALDPDNPDANTTSSLALLQVGRYEEAVARTRRAVQLAPGSADAATLACFVLAFAGYPEEAVAHGERAMTLSPNYPPYYLGHLGNAYRLCGRNEEAITAFKAFHERAPGFGLVDLVIIYQQIGQSEEAARLAKQLVSLRHGFTIEDWANTQFRADSAGLQADIEALHAAGLM